MKEIIFFYDFSQTFEKNANLIDGYIYTVVMKCFATTLFH